MRNAKLPGLVIAITGIGIVLATAAWLLARSQERDQLLRDHVASEQVVAQTGAAGIGAIIEGSASELDRLSRLPSVRYLRDQDRLRRSLDSFLDRTPVRPIALVRIDTTGQILFVYPEMRDGGKALRVLRDLGYLRRAGTSTAGLLSPPLEGPDRSRFVALSDLIQPDGSAPLGAIIALLPAASLAEPTEGAGRSGRAILRFTDGTVLHETSAGGPESAIGGGEAARRTGQSIRVRASVPAEVEPRLQLELWSTRADAFAPLRQGSRTQLFLLLLTNGLIAIGGGFLARELWVRRRLGETLERRTELEMRLRQADRLKTVGRLTGGVAHDFNNILTGLVGHAAFAAEALEADHPAREDVEEIRRAADRATSLVKQLLAFSRQQVLAPQVLVPSEVVGSLEPMLRRVIGEDLNLIVSAAPDLHPVKVDRTQLEQVVVNLVVNARDAMPTGGTVRIELEDQLITPAVAVRRSFTFAPGAYVRLSVSDTGVGIDEAAREHVFEPFFTTKAPSGGTGLGLATVYGIVKQSGGYIEVRTEPGRGTTFDVWLPRSETSVEGSTPLEHGRVNEPAEGISVLVVDDDPGIRRLALRILGRKGYSVLVADGPFAALALASRRTAPLDLLVTDIVMPGMDGRELARRMAELQPGLRTLFMSGYTEDEGSRREGLSGSGNTFISKPFTPEQLLDTMARVVEGAKRLETAGAAGFVDIDGEVLQR